MVFKKENFVKLGMVMALIFVAAVSTLKAEEAKSNSAKKIELKFRNSSDLDYFKNLTPEIISFTQKTPMSAAISDLKEKRGFRCGVLLFDEKKHEGSEVNRYGVGTYSMTFIVLPTGSYSFGIMLGDRSMLDPIYAEQRSAIYCYGEYNGGGYAFVLSVNGNKKKSKALGKWVWSKKWYKMVLNVESDTDVSAHIIDLSTNKAVDTLRYKSESPLKNLPAKLHIITETHFPEIIGDFLKVGRFIVEPGFNL